MLPAAKKLKTTPNGSSTDCSPKKLIVTGAAFCTESMAIATIQIAGISTSKGFCMAEADARLPVYTWSSVGGDAAGLSVSDELSLLRAAEARLESNDGGQAVQSRVEAFAMSCSIPAVSAP